jgi:hypothetical protein
MHSEVALDERSWRNPPQVIKLWLPVHTKGDDTQFIFMYVEMQGEDDRKITRIGYSNRKKHY